MLENLITRASLFLGTLLLSFNLSANDWTVGTSSVLDLRNQTGTIQHNLGDDSRSGLVDIGFDFEFFNQTYDKGYISTNGCFSFTTAYCNDYTPDPLPDTNYTIYPFWTDLIRDNQSKILSKSFEDYFVVGWYDLREYNRSNSDNTFEMFLYEQDSKIEFRYGALDIKTHDVVIGIQGDSNNYKQYLFFDECNTGTTNLSTCVNQDWNNSSFNTLLENKSLAYNDACSINPLSSTECAGYQAAYLVQQCTLNPLYDSTCTGYWNAYEDLQCDLDPQYAPFCPGYTTQQSVAYFVEDEYDYGYFEEEVDYGYIEEEYYYEEPPEYFQEFYSQEHVDDPFLPIVIDDIPEELIWLDPPEEHLPFDDLVYIIEEELPEIIEDLPIFEEEMLEFLPDFEEYDLEYVVHLEEPLLQEVERMLLMEEVPEETIEEVLEFETIEELDEWFEEETSEEELLEEEAEIEEEEDVEEELDEELEEDEKANKRENQLKVVKGTMIAAVNSVSGTTSGSSIHSTGNTIASGGTTSSTSKQATVASSTGGTVSFSSSPSISAQVVSSVAQTQQVLTMSSNVNTGSTVQNVSSSSVESTSSSEVSTEITTTVADVSSTVNTVDTNIASTESMGDSATNTQATQEVKTVAQNIKQQQQQMEEQQSETGEYADSSQLIAYMGFVEGFDAYRNAAMPPQPTWYEPKTIYANAVLPDNTQAFYGLASTSINTLNQMRNLQPNLDGGNHGMVK